MKKPSLLIMLIVPLIVAAVMWATPNSRASLAGTTMIPTVTLPSPMTNCDPQNIPGVASDAAGGQGAPAIKPHLCSIPTFIEQDARQYMGTIHTFTGFRIQQVSSQFTITRVLLVTNQAANDILNADTGVVSDTLVVCYVEVYGDFTVIPPFATRKDTPILHHGQMVFDGVTGNILVMGVMA